jgi:hypothetical protein
MTMLKPLADNYNYYPRTMIRLCEISYDDISIIPSEVQQLGLDVVWGPVELVSWLDVSYSLAYVCMREDPNEYTLVIRGTNMDSWDSWEKEDFAIGTLRLFNELAPHAPASALISHGTYRGIKDLLKLNDPNTGAGIADFLSKANPTYLYITGHSLGGTLTPPMFAYLNDVLYGGGYVHNMAMWTFAGLTPGDAGFNTYFNSLSNPEFQWRLNNTLDIAPFCWWSLEDIQNIYQPYGLSWGWPEDNLLEDLFSRAAGKGYAQPVGDQALPGIFNADIIDDYLWVAQASYQHHSTTYQTLVDNAYPES